MPDNPWTWALAIVVFGLLVFLALRFGRGLRMKVRDLVEVDVKESSQPSTVIVGKAAEFDEAEVEDITGLKVQGKVDLPKIDTADVLPGTRFKKSKVRDITGIKLTGERDKPSSSKKG